MNIRPTKNLFLGSINFLIGMMLTILIYHHLINWLMSVGTAWSKGTQIISTILALAISAIPFIFGMAGLTGYVEKHLKQTGQITEGGTP
jgi:hypothetical protein